MNGSASVPVDTGMTHDAQMAEVEAAIARNLEDYVAAVAAAGLDAPVTSLAVAGGVAAFTGVGSPLTTVKGIGPTLTASDLDEIEGFFREQGQPSVTIELAPWRSGSTADLLGERGYRVDGSEDVVVAIAGRRSAATGDPVPIRVPPVEDVPADEQAGVVRYVHGLEEGTTLERLVLASLDLPGSELLGVRGGSAGWLACAQSVPYGSVWVLGNDGTHPSAERQGAQRSLIEQRLARVPRGNTVTAEVAPGSGSERNYQRAGFAVAYARTHHVRTLR